VRAKASENKIEIENEIKKLNAIINILMGEKKVNMSLLTKCETMIVR
jgi:hypothetical protein